MTGKPMRWNCSNQDYWEKHSIVKYYIKINKPYFKYKVDKLAVDCDYNLSQFSRKLN